MSNRRSRAPLPLAILFVVLGVLVVVGFLARTWRPFLASEHGAGIDKVITYLMLCTGVIFVVGHLVLGWLVWRFKDDGQDDRFERPSRAQEWAWAAVPLVLFVGVSEFGVVILGGPAWDKVYGEPPADALHIEVVGKQFEWIVRYPGKDGKFGRAKAELVEEPENPIGLDEDDPAGTDDVFLRNTMHLPVGRHVVLRLRSNDVLHSVWLPNFRVKQDLIPGITTRAQFRPTETGQYELGCAELCGLGHFRMRGLVHVESTADFERWMSEQKGWLQ